MRPIVDVTGKRLLWADHLDALCYAEARYLIHGRRQMVRLVTVNGSLLWHVHVADVHRQKLGGAV